MSRLTDALSRLANGLFRFRKTSLNPVLRAREAEENALFAKDDPPTARTVDAILGQQENLKRTFDYIEEGEKVRRRRYLALMWGPIVAERAIDYAQAAPVPAATGTAIAVALAAAAASLKTTFNIYATRKACDQAVALTGVMLAPVGLANPAACIESERLQERLRAHMLRPEDGKQRQRALTLVSSLADRAPDAAARSRAFRETLHAALSVPGLHREARGIFTRLNQTAHRKKALTLGHRRWHGR